MYKAFASSSLHLEDVNLGAGVFGILARHEDSVDQPLHPVNLRALDVRFRDFCSLVVTISPVRPAFFLLAALLLYMPPVPISLTAIGEPHFHNQISVLPVLSNLCPVYIYLRGPGSVVGIATGYGLDGPGIESRWGRDFLHLSRSALGPTQPPVQRVPGLSRGKERSGRDADLSPPSSAVV